MLLLSNSCNNGQKTNKIAVDKYQTIAINNSNNEKGGCNKNEMNYSLSNYSIDSLYKIFTFFIKTSNDSCTLEYLNLVCNNYIANKTERNFGILNQFACSFDGYISEIFIDYMPQFIKKNNTIFFKQLFTQSLEHNKNICLEEFTKSYLKTYDTDLTFKKLITREKNTANMGYKNYLDKLLNY